MDKLQWGNRKRLRCVKVKEPSLFGKSEASNGGGVVKKKKITSRVIDNNNNDNHHRTNNNSNNGDVNISCKDGNTGSSVQSPLHRSNRDISSRSHDIRKTAIASLSPEKEDNRYYYYTTRGSGGLDDGSSKSLFANPKEEESRKLLWPKLLITLTSKEKEEDFMAMKGCRPPQRPKKRAKLIQRTVLSVCPGVWLTDLCQERYEIREKKTSKKKPRGLKGLGGVESDSE